MEPPLLSEYYCQQLTEHIPSGIYIIDGTVYTIKMSFKSSKPRFLQTIPFYSVTKVDCLVCLGRIREEYLRKIPNNAKWL